MSLSCYEDIGALLGFPRLRGDEPAPTQMIRTWLAFSPPTRG